MIAALALALALGSAPPPPLVCPPGLQKKGDEPFEGYEVWCEAKDVAGNGVREGPARRYYDDGSIWVEEVFSKGKRHGPFVEYHRNGRRAREGAYDEDRQVGLWVIRWPSGALEEEAEFKNGTAHGRFVAYHPDGTKRTEGRRCGGAPCGVWRTWSEKGEPLGQVEYSEQMFAP